jgi:hypothetical protein
VEAGTRAAPLRQGFMLEYVTQGWNVAGVVILAGRSSWILAAGYRPRHSLAGTTRTAVTAIMMFALAAGKSPDRRDAR